MPIKTLSDFQKNEITEENVIIGSGAGGSTTAYELLKKGKSSLILEEGPAAEFDNKKKLEIELLNFIKIMVQLPFIHFRVAR